MGKYLKSFNNHTLYESFTETEDFIKPNVSYCIQEDEVHYNQYTTTTTTTTEPPYGTSLPSNRDNIQLTGYTFPSYNYVPEGAYVGEIELDGNIYYLICTNLNVDQGRMDMSIELSCGRVNVTVFLVSAKL